MITKYNKVYNYLEEHYVTDYYINYKYPCHYICTNADFQFNRLYIICATLPPEIRYPGEDINISKKDVDFIMNCQDEDIIKLFILKLINERL
jgi:hypothetical protein